VDSPRPREPRGAGRGGGLVFLVVAAFVAYLAVDAVAGALRLVLAGVLLIVLGLLAANVLRR
jgi:hypothetical protein